MMLAGKTDTLESYREEVVDRLLQLRRQYPCWWLKMAVQIDETSGAKALSQGSIAHWLEQPSDATSPN